MTIIQFTQGCADSSGASTISFQNVTITGLISGASSSYLFQFFNIHHFTLTNVIIR